MKTLLLMMAGFAAPLVAAAQTPGAGAQGYVFAAPGVELKRFPGPAALHLGGGGEWVFGSRFGLGAEIGAVGPLPGYTNWRTGYTLALGSANLSYYFPPTSGGRVEPFVTAGYAVRIRAGTFHGVNVGGGVQTWLQEHVALRFEFRNTNTPGFHHLGFRFGLAFR